MSKRSLPILIAGWLITVVAGFIAGQRTSPSPRHTTGGESAAPAGDSRMRSSRSGRPTAGREARGDTRDLDRQAAGNLDEILGDLDRNERSRRFLDFIARLSDDDFAGLAAELSTGPMAEMNRGAYRMLLTEWAGRDPYAAADYIRAYARSDWEREAVLAAWAVHSPQAAFDWASNTEDEGEVNNWISGAMRGIAAADPELARRLLEAMDDGPTRRHALSRSAGALAALGTDAAGNWLAGISDEQFRRQAARQLAGPLVRGDSPAAAGWVASISDTAARRDASEVVAEHWARTDIESAREWVESLPADTRSEAAEGVARQFGRNDPQRGAEWLASLGDDPDLDGARQRFLDGAWERAPEAAISVANTLAADRVRASYYQRILNRWLARDANAVRAWVDENPGALPENLVRQIRRAR